MSFLLREILLEPRRIADLDMSQFNQLIPQARSTRLLASLAFRLDSEGLLEEVPGTVRRHLDSAVIVYEKQVRDLEFDAGKIKQALAEVGEKLVLLKGAAYIQAGLPVGNGRLISDIDIIVPRPQIDEVEQSLNRAGWESSQLDPYNERYYRQWMHEIPPLGNRRRGSTVDLHHTILPPTANANVDAGLLFENLIELRSGIFTLSWQDMVIHSATHLFHEGEFNHGLRDLWDLDRMLRDFPERDPAFWEGVVARARQLDLVDSLFHGLTYSKAVFATPIPSAVLEQASSWSRLLRKPLMDILFLRAFRPPQPDCQLPLTAPARYLLYVRSHYLRMPLYLLLPHLARKAWMSQFGDGTQAEEAPEAIEK